MYHLVLDTGTGTASSVDPHPNHIPLHPCFNRDIHVLHKDPSNCKAAELYSPMSLPKTGRPTRCWSPWVPTDGGQAPITNSCDFIHSWDTLLLKVYWNLKDRKSFNNIVKICPKMIGVQQRDLWLFYGEQTAGKTKGTIRLPNHVLHSEFTVSSSGLKALKLLPQKQIATSRPSYLLLSGCAMPTHSLTES